MPTGYTAQLENMDYDVSRWIKEGAVRAMGVCISLRDSASDIPQEKIRESLIEGSQDRPDTYHQTQCKRLQDNLKKFEKRTKAEWKKEFIKEQKKAWADFNARVTEWEQKKAAHQASLDKITKLYEKAEKEKQTELILGTLKFAKNQLTQTMDWDYKSPPYREDILDIKTAEKWADKLIQKAKNDIDYHKVELIKVKKKIRSFNPIEEYDKLVAFVDKNS